MDLSAWYQRCARNESKVADLQLWTADELKKRIALEAKVSALTTAIAELRTVVDSINEHLYDGSGDPDGA